MTAGIGTSLGKEHPMNRREAIAALPVATAAAQTANPGVRDRFVGVWKLVSCESRDKASGEIGYRTEGIRLAD
jgi:hypothetical protein